MIMLGSESRFYTIVMITAWSLVLDGSDGYYLFLLRKFISSCSD